tara:strand:- start:3431 stop:4435 length:1005 start_codon:yes stop_codon:yes gene_type:complete
MAVKFSEFTAKSLVSDVTEVVGYLTSGELNVRIPPANLDTTYVVSTGNAGASPTINLQGTKPNQPAISPSTVSLTGSGATLLNGDGSTTVDFASTVYTLSATDNADPAQNTPVLLDGVGGGDVGTDTINIIGSGTVGVTSSSGTITINGTGGGGSGTVTSIGLTETGSALTITNSPITTSGDINIAGAGTASQVILGDLSLGTLTSGTVTSVGLDVTAIAAFNSSGGTNPVTATGDLTIGITGGAAGQYLDYTGAWSTPSGGGGGTFTVATVAGTGSNDTLALGVSPGSDDNVQLYIDGVYQSKSAYTVTGSNLVLDGGEKFPNGSAVEATTIT